MKAAYNAAERSRNANILVPFTKIYVARAFGPWVGLAIAQSAINAVRRKLDAHADEALAAHRAGRSRDL